MPDTDFPEVTQFDGGPKELRDAYDRLRKAHSKLQGETTGLLGDLRGVRIGQAGFPEGSKQHTALLKHYSGDIADRDAIVTFAADEFGYEPEPSEPVAPPSPDAVATGQARLSALAGDARTRSLGGPVGQAEKLLAEIVKADVEDRAADAVALRNQYAVLTRAKG